MNMYFYLLVLVLSVLAEAMPYDNNCADKYEDEIAANFKKWAPASGHKTALTYAQHLSHQHDETAKKHAQAIILYGVGFGGFAKGRTATPDEMNQYFDIVNHLNSLVPDEASLIRTDRGDVTYHQNVMLLLLRQAGGLHKETGHIFGAPLPSYDAFAWLGRYAAYHNKTLGLIYDALDNRITPFFERGEAVYSGMFAAVPHVHPYGTGEEETNFAHHCFRYKGSFINWAESLEAWKGKSLLFRPHAYLGAKENIKAGKAWNQNVVASVTLLDGSVKNISGPVHIHDNVASPNGVMTIQKSMDPAQPDFFTTAITSPNHHPVQTLHILIPPGKGGADLTSFDTYGIIGFLSFIMGDTFNYQSFLDQVLGLG